MIPDEPFTLETIEQQIAELKEFAQEDETPSNSPNQHLIQNLQLLYKGFETDVDSLSRVYQRVLQQTDQSIKPSEQKIASLKTATSKPRTSIVRSGVRMGSFRRPRLIAAMFLLGVLAAGSLVFALSHKSAPFLAQRAATPTTTSVKIQGTPFPTSSAGISDGLEIGYEPQPLLYQNTLYISSGNDIRTYSAENGAFERTYPVSDVNNLIIIDGILYASTINSTLALRLSDGKVLWQTPFGNATLPVFVNGVLYEYASNSSNDRSLRGICAIQAVDGKILWQYKLNELDNVSSPIIIQGEVYFSTYFYNPATQNYDARIYALNGVNGSLLWQQSFSQTTISNLMTDGENFFASANESVEAFDGNGKVLWRTHLPNSSQENTSGAILSTVANGVVYVIGEYETIYALRITDGALLWDYQLDSGPYVGSFSIDGNALYVGILPDSPHYMNNISSVLAVRISDGHLLWQKQLSLEQTMHPIAAHGVIYVVYSIPGSGQNKILAALQEDDGHTIWTSSINLK